MSLIAHFKGKHADLHGIGSYLIALVVLALVPLALIAGILVARQGALQHEAFERSLLQTAFALSVAVDRQLDSYRVMLDTLAQAEELERGQIDEFHALAERVATKHGAIFISLFGPDGEQIFNTLRPAGAPLPNLFKDPRVEVNGADRPPVGDPSTLTDVLKTGKPTNSDLLYGLVAQRLLFTMNIPVLRDGKVAYVLNAAFDPEVMSRLLKDHPHFSGVPAVVFDRRGFIVGRWKDADKFVGTRTSAHQRGDALVTTGEAGVGVGRTLEGLDVYFSHARSPSTGWGVNVGTVRTQLDRDVRTSWLIGGALAAGGLAMGLLMALGLASRLRKSIAALADAASRSEAPHLTGLRTREIAQLEHALGDAAAAREVQAEEREKLLVATTREAEAVEANRVKDHFIAVLSHELRNPLAPIRNGVALLRAMPVNRDSAAMVQVVAMLDRQSAQLTRLVNDLLDVSRINSGKITLRRERVDLCAVAHHAIEQALPGLNARRHQLVQNIPREPVMVLGDFARLSQVISNLLDNAAKYTPEAGLVTLSIAVDNANAVLTVQDNGRGIDPQFLPVIFMSPYLGARDSIRKADGLGLGLPLAKALVELHGGFLEASSDGVGMGSRFALRLPVAESSDASAQAPQRMPESAFRPPSRRVLVVDDNVDAAISLQMLLEALGHETSVAHDGARALEVAADFRPEIILLDIGLPKLDGYEVARRLRKLDNGQAFRIVAVTGWGQQSDKLKAKEAGFDRHLVKPVGMSDLQTLFD